MIYLVFAVINQYKIIAGALVFIKSYIHNNVI